MPPKKQLSEIKRAQIVALFGEGYSQIEIAMKMECSRKGVQTTIKRYNETKSFKNRKGQGRKKVYNRQGSQIFEKIGGKVLQSLLLNLEGCKQTHISSNSGRRLLEVGLKGCKARKKPYLSRANKKKATGICNPTTKKNMKIGHLMIGAKLFGLTKVTLR